MRIKNKWLQFLLGFCLVGSIAVAEVEQTRESSAPPAQRRVVLVSPSESVGAVNSDEVRFNLDFPGGSPQELIAALSEASGGAVNAFIPEKADQFVMPPLKYHNISLTEVLSILSSVKTVEFVNQVNGRHSRGEYRKGYSWGKKASVWVMRVEVPPVVPVEFLVQPFSISSLLEVYSIDDITTTIDSAWRLNNASAENQLMFHPETKILLVKSTASDLEILEKVLDTLTNALPPQEILKSTITVSVLGSVNKPGNYEFERGALITLGLAEAGGVARIGNPKSVKVVRVEQDQGETQIQVNLTDILNGKAANIELSDGDTIVVPERIL